MFVVIILKGFGPLDDKKQFMIIKELTMQYIRQVVIFLNFLDFYTSLFEAQHSTIGESKCSLTQCHDSVNCSNLFVRFQSEMKDSRQSFQIMYTKGNAVRWRQYLMSHSEWLYFPENKSHMTVSHAHTKTQVSCIRLHLHTSKTKHYKHYKCVFYFPSTTNFLHLMCVIKIMVIW